MSAIPRPRYERGMVELPSLRNTLTLSETGYSKRCDLPDLHFVRCVYTPLLYPRKDAPASYEAPLLLSYLPSARAPLSPPFNG